MAPAATQPKQKSRKNRKARTEVSSSSESSSSDSESSSSATPEPQPKERTTKPSKVPKDVPAAESSEPESPPPASKPPSKDPDQVFQDFYLKQATKEFSEDLDKLRSASDWRGQGSLEVLVGALQQGGACFGEGEKRKVGGAGS